MRAARESYAHERRLTHLTAQLTLRVGEPMRLRVSDGKHVFEAVGEETQAARNKPLDASRVREQLQKTGGTPYVLTAIDLDADETAFAAASQLNALRRAALEGMTAARVSAFAPEKSRICGGAFARAAPGGGEDAPHRPLRPAGTPAGGAGSGRGRIGARPLRLAAGGFGRLPCRAGRGALLPRPARRGQRGCAWTAYARGRGRTGSVSRRSTPPTSPIWAWTGAWRCAAISPSTSSTPAPWRRRGLRATCPRLELTARQMADMPGEKELLIWGRAPLMRLRHCPLRAAQKLPGPHDACRRCDRAGEPIDGMALTDRRGAAFPAAARGLGRRLRGGGAQQRAALAAAQVRTPLRLLGLGAASPRGRAGQGDRLRLPRRPRRQRRRPCALCRHADDHRTRFPRRGVTRRGKINIRTTSGE